MKKLSGLDMISLILVIVGGLNWALVGLFGFDLIATIFGEMSVLSRIIYILVGLGAIYLLINLGSYKKETAALKSPNQP